MTTELYTELSVVAQVRQPIIMLCPLTCWDYFDELSYFDAR